MTSRGYEEVESGPRAAAISNAIVQLLHDYSGRGPTHARTTIAEDLIVCVLADALTRSERRLVEAGEQSIVLEQRVAVQKIMREDAVAAVERLSGRTVRAFMSNNHVDPDLAVETFVLAPLPSPGAFGRDGEPQAAHRRAGDPTTPKTQPGADRSPDDDSPAPWRA
jgi:uncharacterized protein YbcI